MPAAPIVDLHPGQFRITHFQDYNYQWHEYPYTGNTKYTKEGVERLWPQSFKGLAVGTQIVQALRFTGGIEYHGFGDWITPAPGQPAPPSNATNNPIPLTGVLVIRVDRATGQVLNSFVEYK